MIKLNDLRNLHAVKQIKKLTYKWWGIDTLVMDEKSFANYPYLEPKEKPVFQNPFIKELFQNKQAQADFCKTLQFISKQDIQNINSLMEKWSVTGLSLFIVPIKTYSCITGFVVAAGFIENQDEEKIEDLKKYFLNLNLKAEWFEENKKNIPFLPKQDKEHFMDLMERMAQEIASVQTEFIDKNHQIKQVSTSHNLTYGGMIGKSQAMQQLYSLLDKIKHSENTILIQGENGTGKELIAKSIHQNSPRKTQAFIIQNCAALNDNLLESELFGHVKGSFTGAYKDKKGLFEMAHQGTFFLDEVGDTSPAMQVKLLRVLQEGTFFPVGSVEPKKVDVRIIAATNKKLRDLVEEGRFRKDLYYRLNVINIRVPALREKAEDIPLLADYFVNHFSKQPKILTNRALENLKQYHWPGNVRELQNEAERLTVFTGNDVYIKEEFLSDKIKNKETNLQFISDLDTNNYNGKVMKKAIAQLERQMISQCLKQEGWNKTKVAKKLGISRAALVSKVKSYKLKRGPMDFKKKTSS